MKKGFLLAALCAVLFWPATAGAHRYWWGGVYVHDPFWGAPGYAVRYAGPPNRGAIKTDIEPEEAHVIVDGKDMGEADDFDGFPGYLILRPGHRHIEFRHKGYKTLVVDVNMKSGWLLKLDDDMDHGDPREKVVRRSTPPAVDDEGPTDDSDRTRHERHRMDTPDREDRDDAEDDDYEDDQSSYRDESRTLHHGGEASGSVRFDIDPADASVYVDGEYRGSARELGRGIELPAGDHKVVVTRDGYEDRELSISVDRGTKSEVNVELLRSPRS